MSVVDQQARLATGRVRRLLLRAVLVLGGAFAATVIGWLLWAGTANAGELPTMPSVPSVVGGVDDAVAQVSTQDVTGLRPAALPSASLVPAPLPATPLQGNTLPDTGLAGVTHQATLPVTIDRVVPAVPSVPVAAPLAGRAAPAVAMVPAAAAPVRGVTTKPLQYKHNSGVVSGRAPVGQVAPTRPGAWPHVPVLPPVQPAGSSDSSAHGATGFAGGSGGPQAPFQHVLGSGIDLAGTPSTPRLSVVPGQQPGTSPD